MHGLLWRIEATPRRPVDGEVDQLHRLVQLIAFAEVSIIEIPGLHRPHALFFARCASNGHIRSRCTLFRIISSDTAKIDGYFSGLSSPSLTILKCYPD